MGEREDVSRARRRGAAVLAAGALTLCLGAVGCGGDGGGSASSSPPGTASGTTTTAPSTGGTDGDGFPLPPEPLPGGDPATCEAIAAVNDSASPGHEERVEAARAVDPPAELEEVWDDFLDGAVPFSLGDDSDEELIDRFLVAFGLVGAYAGTYCPLG
jgi:hypothetical protein